MKPTRTAIISVSIMASMLSATSEAARQSVSPNPPGSTSPPSSPGPGARATRADANPHSDAAGLAALVADTHGRDAWNRKDALRCRITVRFGEEIVFDGVMIQETKGKRRARIDVSDGTTLLFDGESSWISPASDESQPAGNHLATWPRLVAMPFTLVEAAPGAQLESGEMKELQGKRYRTATLTLEKSAREGEAVIENETDVEADPARAAKSIDKYLLFIDPATNVLKAIVSDTEEGVHGVDTGAGAGSAHEPLAIIFDSFGVHDYIVLPKRWTIYRWSEAEGVLGEAVGSVLLDDIEFITPGADSFAKPANAQVIETQHKPEVATSQE